MLDILQNCLLTDINWGVQAANLLFGAAAEPHDFLHEPLFRILSTGLLSAAASSFALKVGCLPQQ